VTGAPAAAAASSASLSSVPQYTVENTGFSLLEMGSDAGVVLTGSQQIIAGNDGNYYVVVAAGDGSHRLVSLVNVDGGTDAASDAVDGRRQPAMQDSTASAVDLSYSG
jgi:hypothetical protein